MIKEAIQCLPRGICSWDFDLRGKGHNAVLKFRWTSEQGLIEISGSRYTIRKHGVFSGRWTMDHDEREIAEGQKVSAMKRAMKVTGPMGDLDLVPESAFTRTFRIERSGKTLARIKPDHAFTRRAQIELATRDFDFTTICFAFWLVLMGWRRAAESES